MFHDGRDPPRLDGRGGVCLSLEFAPLPEETSPRPRELDVSQDRLGITHVELLLRQVFSVRGVLESQPAPVVPRELVLIMVEGQTAEAEVRVVVTDAGAHLTPIPLALLNPVLVT